MSLAPRCAKPIGVRSMAAPRPTMAVRSYPFNQAGVGLTDLELRYNVTEQLQFAFGANNIFNIRPDVRPMPRTEC